MMVLKLKNIVAVLVIAVFASCTKDWLDVTSSSQIKAEDQFKSEAGFKDALLGAYIGMTDKSLYSRDLTWNIVDLLAQQYAALPNTGGSNSGTYSDVQKFNYRTALSMPQVDAMWNKQYNVIANINIELSYIEKNRGVLQSLNYTLIKGELLGMRAFLHFDLLRLYGYGNLSGRQDVAGKLAPPYVTEFTKAMTQQLSYAETFALLNKDITDALELLKQDPAYKEAGRPADYYSGVNGDGFYDKRQQRMNYYAVKALEARVLLWQGGQDNLNKARAAAEEVINNSPARLVTSPASLSRDRVLSAEHLFGLNVTAFIDIVNPFLNANNVTDAGKKNSLYLSQSTAEQIYETSNINIGIADFRYNTLLQSQSAGRVPMKLWQVFSTTDVYNIMPLIRLPEMYYIAAEAYGKSSNRGKSVEYLNIVRRSRGILEDIPLNADEQRVFAELDKEYRKEFISEGQLFFYYKRLGKTTFPNLPSSITANDRIYVLPYPDSEFEFGRVQ